MIKIANEQSPIKGKYRTRFSFQDCDKNDIEDFLDTMKMVDRETYLGMKDLFSFMYK